MNSPAFPSGKSEKQGFENSHPLHEGMTLLDYFAASAIPNVVQGMTTGVIGFHEQAGGGPAGFAKTAYEIAEAMLAERAKRVIE